MSDVQPNSNLIFKNTDKPHTYLDTLILIVLLRVLTLSRQTVQRYLQVEANQVKENYDCGHKFGL